MQTSQDHTEPTEGQKKNFCFVVLKVKNVTSHDVINIFREENTARESKNKETQLAMHQRLDSMSAANKKKEKEARSTMMTTWWDLNCFTLFLLRAKMFVFFSVAKKCVLLD